MVHSREAHSQLDAVWRLCYIAQVGVFVVLAFSSSHSILSGIVGKESQGLVHLGSESSEHIMVKILGLRHVATSPHLILVVPNYLLFLYGQAKQK